MRKEGQDRRVRKTRKQLKDCLIQLLKEKKVQDITVRELTEMADLNRGTFYLHYKDVFDLLEKTEAELFEEFNSLVLSHDAQDLKQRPSLIFHEIFSLVYENADLVEILMGERAALRRHRSRWPFSRNRLFSRESMSWSAKNRLPIRRPAVYNRNTRPAALPGWLSRHVQGDSLCQKKIYIR